MEKAKVKYPIGEQSFPVLREEGFLYVDKTRFIERIVNGKKYYFLGRPRRFGKSLFLSTLRAFFEGKREFFKGLYADTMEWDWLPYPVLYLDLNNLKYKGEGQLYEFIDDFLTKEEKKYGIKAISDENSLRFATIIRTAAEQTGRRVVILVDEYDKPLVNNLHNQQLYDSYRNQLAELYSNFKSSADYIRLVFLTGVSRFAKLSVFSDLNNIADVSFDQEFADICGITEEELLENFKEGIEELSTTNNRSSKEELAELKRYYDGYHFSMLSPDIYNPFSILNVFDKRYYQNYWIASGMPTLLAEQLKRDRTDLTQLVKARSGLSGLQGLDLSSTNPIALFYQTGYLTIKSYNKKRNIFQLGLPNEEVKEGFFNFILPYYSNVKKGTQETLIADFCDDLDSGNVDAFMKRLIAFFSGIPYEMGYEDEKNVQNAIFILFTLIGLQTDVEVHTSDGRIDILIRTEDYVYIMELKYDRSAEEALNQIEEKRYALPWATDSRQVIAIGINYSRNLRRIDSWLSKPLH